MYTLKIDNGQQFNTIYEIDKNGSWYNPQTLPDGVSKEEKEFATEGDVLEFIGEKKEDYEYSLYEGKHKFIKFL